MSTVWFDMPTPPGGRNWCQACAMLAKAHINDRYGKVIIDAGQDGLDRDIFIKPDKTPHMEPAVVLGICAELQQLGMLHLCWTHLAGIQVQAVSPLDPRFNGGGQALPAGLVAGKR